MQPFCEDELKMQIDAVEVPRLIYDCELQRQREKKTIFKIYSRKSRK